MADESQYLVLTPERVMSAMAQALASAFLWPFFFKWWCPANEIKKMD
jgi:hypothetical protein